MGFKQFLSLPEVRRKQTDRTKAILSAMILMAALAGCLSDEDSHSRPSVAPDTLELVHFDASIELPTGSLHHHVGVERDTRWSFTGESQNVAGPKGPVDNALVIRFDDGANISAVYLHPDTLEPISIQYMGQSRVQMIPDLDWIAMSQLAPFLPFRLSNMDLDQDGEGTVTFIGFQFDYEYQGENQWRFTTQSKVMKGGSVTGTLNETWGFFLHPKTTIPTYVDNHIRSSNNKEVLRTSDIQIYDTNARYDASPESYYSDSPYRTLHPWDTLPPEDDPPVTPWRLFEAIDDARDLNNDIDDFLDRNPEFFIRYAEFTQRSPFPVSVDTTAWRFAWQFELWGDQEKINFWVHWWNPVLPQTLSEGHKEVADVEENPRTTELHAPSNRDPILAWDETYDLCSGLAPGHDRTIGFADRGHDNVEFEVGGVSPYSNTIYSCQNINGPGFRLDANTGYFTAWID
jgi:hypothetical protein